MLKPGPAYNSDTAQLKTPCGDLYCTTIYTDNHKPAEVVLHLGKAGGCAKAHLSVLSSSVNTALKHNDGDVVLVLTNITGFSCAEGRESCSSVAAQYILDRVLKRREDYSDDE